MKTEVKRPDAIDLAAIEAELRPQSTDRLKARFFECYDGAARLIAEAAVCIKLMSERGENLAGIPMAGTFKRIAAGQILPELVWKFIESPNRQRVERLPLEDQKRLVANPMVPIVEPRHEPGTGYTTRMVDLSKAPTDVAKLAIGYDGIRTPEEQIAELAAQKASPKRTLAAMKEEEIREPLSRSV